MLAIVGWNPDPPHKKQVDLPASDVIDRSAGLAGVTKPARTDEVIK
jgi:hypothetical protein